MEFTNLCSQYDNKFTIKKFIAFKTTHFQQRAVKSRHGLIYSFQWDKEASFLVLQSIKRETGTRNFKTLTLLKFVGQQFSKKLIK